MTQNTNDIRHDWTINEIISLFEMSFMDLVFMAQSAHRKYFNASEIEASTLLSIKTGACPEDCKYCPQSVRYDTGLKREALLDKDTVIQAARAARSRRT